MYDNDSPTDSYFLTTYIPGSSLAEQAGAGVQPYENPFSAAAKVEIYRRNNGLDIYTGLPVIQQYQKHHVSSSPGGGNHVAHADRPVAEPADDRVKRSGNMRKTTKIMFAILGCAMVFYIAHIVKLLGTYDIRNPPAYIADLIR